MNGTSKEDKAILLSKTLSIDGVSMATEDTMGRLMSECLKINDIVHFDCHIYDKLGTVGSGKDRSVVYPKTQHPTFFYDDKCIFNIEILLPFPVCRCNFYAMKAWKNSAEYELKNGSGGTGGLIGITGTTGQGS